LWKHERTHAKKRKRKKERKILEYYKGVHFDNEEEEQEKDFYLVIGSYLAFHLSMLNFDDVKNLLREGLRDEAEHVAELQADLQQFG